MQKRLKSRFNFKVSESVSDPFMSIGIGNFGLEFILQTTNIFDTFRHTYELFVALGKILME